MAENLFKNSLSVLILIIAVSFIPGCSGNNEGDVKGEKLNFDIMYTEYYAPFPDKMFIVIQNEKDFRDFINRTGMIFQPPDFEKYTVLALFMGEQKKGGYAITVDRIVREDGVVRVYVKNLVPSETCFVTQQITRPFQIVKVEKITEKIEFVESTQEVSC